jgi:hypothetical protein
MMQALLEIRVWEDTRIDESAMFARLRDEPSLHWIWILPIFALTLLRNMTVSSCYGFITKISDT